MAAKMAIGEFKFQTMVNQPKQSKSAPEYKTSPPYLNYSGVIHMQAMSTKPIWTLNIR